jgi:hypothetical protein
MRRVPLMLTGLVAVSLLTPGPTAGAASAPRTASAATLATAPIVTRIVGFDASPEPSYRHAYTTISGYLQYDVPKIIAWHGLGNKTITITRGSYTTTAVTGAHGYFRVTKSGVAPTVTGVWHASYAGSTTYRPSVSVGDFVEAVTPPIRIVQVLYDPAGSDNANPNLEHITIYNRGTRSANLYGWTVKGLHSSPYTFTTPFYVPPGGRFTIYSGRGVRTATHVFMGRINAQTWANADTATIVNDLGKVEDACSWPGGSRTAIC